MSQPKKEEMNLNQWIKEYEKEKKKNMLPANKYEKLFNELEQNILKLSEKHRSIDEHMSKCKEHFDLKTYCRLFYRKIELTLDPTYQPSNELESLQLIVDYCDEIPLMDTEYLKKLVNLLETPNEVLSQRATSFASMYANLKLGMSNLFHRNYPEAIRMLNLSRELAKQSNEFELMQTSTLLIANTLTLMGKFSEAIQLVDMIKVESKVLAFSIYCSGGSVDSDKLKPIVFSEEFYRETTDMFEESKPQATSETAPKSARRDTLQTKLKNNASVRKIEYNTTKLKNKISKMFEK